MQMVHAQTFDSITAVLTRANLQNQSFWILGMFFIGMFAQICKPSDQISSNIETYRPC